nr:MAG TPA: hypothetical protein [Caudoviricetes sp.]
MRSAVTTLGSLSPPSTSVMVVFPTPAILASSLCVSPRYSRLSRSFSFIPTTYYHRLAPSCEKWPEFRPSHVEFLRVLSISPLDIAHI